MHLPGSPLLRGHRLNETVSMSTLWRDIRSVLELQQALTGNQLPLTADRKTAARSPTAATGQSGSTASESVEVDNQPSTSADSSSQSSTDPPSSMPTRNLFDDPSSSDASAVNAYERIENLIPEDSPILGIDSLEDLQTYVETTTLISLDQSRQNAVFGVGDPGANLVIIGEAPGAQEDKQGEPFVGRAGKLLDKILEAIDFTRNQVYITNILKSRPPQNRNPRSDEVEAHIPILYKQLALIQPKLILCVGKVAANTLLDRSSSLGSMRGTFHDFHGIPTMVTYHPAALLRNPQWKRPTWEDVKLLRARYDELTPEQ